MARVGGVMVATELKQSESEGTRSCGMWSGWQGLTESPLSRVAVGLKGERDVRSTLHPSRQDDRHD